MNTLRGVFPEPKPVPRKNFIKENMLHIKRMQGLIEDKDVRYKSNKRNKGQIKISPSAKTIKAVNFIENTRKEIEAIRKFANSRKQETVSKTTDKTISPRKPSHQNVKTDYGKQATNVKLSLNNNNLKETGVQTEEFSNVNQLYSKGIIKYPSSHVIAVLAEKKGQTDKSPRHQKLIKVTGDGDNLKRKTEQELKTCPDIGSSKKHDYVKENVDVIKYLTIKPEAAKDPYMVPANYQKGVVPKYIRERKELLRQSQDTVGEECPDGHVILPDNERKETLKMLRQTYSDLISELNMMPVRSDTLKLRNRKIHIENQLKKLDEGIKIFSRPKVYVKIDS